MFDVPFTSTGTHLVLTPRWGELSTPLDALACGSLLLLPLVLALWLYRRELRLVHPLVASLLLMLRLLVLGSVIFLVGFQPIIENSTTEELPGRVLIAVDRSESMEIADPQRTQAEKLQLARAVHVAGDLCSEEQLDDWIRQAERGPITDWVRPTETQDPAQKQKLTEQRRQAFEQVCRRVDQLTRSQIGRQILRSEGQGLLSALSPKHHVELVGFAQQAWAVNASALDRLYEAPKMLAPGAEKQLPLPPPLNLASTDLRQPLARALERTTAEEGKLTGVLLLTDGQHNWGPSPVQKALELGEHQVPIYAIALGARESPPDVAVVSIKAPPAAFKNVDVSVEARIKVSGLPAQDLTIQMESPGKSPQEEHLHYEGGEQYYTVRYQCRLDQVGAQELSVTAKAVAGEIRTDNNRRSTVINVADDKAKVLIVDGEARWEYHYLANALARDRTLETRSVVFNQPRIDKIPEEELEKIGNPLLRLPAKPDALAAYDCIILGDLAPADLTTPDRERLLRYVADRGGTLVVSAGKRYMPLAYVGATAKSLDQDDPLAKLLPIENIHAVQSKNGFHIALAPEGKVAPFMQLEATPDQNEMRWSELPAHFWGAVGRAKAGATPMAFVQEDESGLAGKEKAEREKDQALIIRQNYGFGRVLHVGVDSTWRWRYKTGDTYHHRFWGQVVRWAAADKPLVAGNEHVRFGTQQAVYATGKEVEVTVRFGEGIGTLRPDALSGARIIRKAGGAASKEEAIALVPLARREAQPRVLEGKIRDLPAGQYEIELVIPEVADKLLGPLGPDGRPGKLRAGFTVAAPAGDELYELATNWPLLEELAAKSGGKVFTAEDAKEVVDLLNSRIGSREHHVDRPLWQSWITLVIILALLTTEWVIRKWAGLP